MLFSMARSARPFKPLRLSSDVAVKHLHVAQWFEASITVTLHCCNLQNFYNSLTGMIWHEVPSHKASSIEEEDEQISLGLDPPDAASKVKQAVNEGPTVRSMQTAMLRKRIPTPMAMIGTTSGRGQAPAWAALQARCRAAPASRRARSADRKRTTPPGAATRAVEGQRRGPAPGMLLKNCRHRAGPLVMICSDAACGIEAPERCIQRRP